MFDRTEMELYYRLQNDEKRAIAKCWKFRAGTAQAEEGSVGTADQLSNDRGVYLQAQIRSILNRVGTTDFQSGIEWRLSRIRAKTAAALIRLQK